jgi:predicted RNA-binding protein associated with RNAse of E/G family
MENNIVVHKLNEQGTEVWRYEGVILETDSNAVTLEAQFDRATVDFHEITLTKGDRFVETFFSDRWYNIFAIYDAQDGHFKGWYCNITRPARIEPGHVYAEDLALDLIVYPDGRWLVMDEDEFDQLDIPLQDRELARTSLEALIQLAQNKRGPFRSINMSESGPIEV